MTTRIGIIGDYDASFEPHRATDVSLTHAASALSVDIEAVWLPTTSLDAPHAIQSLASFGGLWVAPGSPYQSMSGALAAIRFARESGLPLLGTCGGFQHIILEYVRHVLGFSDATHAEYAPYSSSLFISRLACSLVGRALLISLMPGSLVARIYGATSVTEQYYCNFGVNPDHIATLACGDLAIVGSDAEGEVRVVELRSHPFFVGTLFVPQLRSQAESPHPLVLGFLNATQNDDYATSTLIRHAGACPTKLVARRRSKFDQWLTERMPVLRDFAAALELPDPPLIIADPERYLPFVEAWIREQVVEADDWAWAVTRIGYFAGEVLVQRFSGCWLVCDAPSSRYFGRYVVGRFSRVPNPAMIADPIEIAAACLSQPPGRSLTNMLEAVGVELLRAAPGAPVEPPAVR